MEILIFAIMASVILYLMYDNRKLEKLNKIAVRAAVKEQMKRKVLEVMLYGHELDDEGLFDDETLYED